jgi:hypothetical protein
LQIACETAGWRPPAGSGTGKNPDGAITFITIDAGEPRAGFVGGSEGGKRQLTIRDGQHTYVYNEAQP